MANDKRFIKVWQGLVDERHYKKMGQSLWLFMWLLKESWQDGEVLNYTHSMCMEHFGVGMVTSRRWLNTLNDNKYIIIKKGSHSRTIKIRKWAGARGIKNDTPAISALSQDDTPALSHRDTPALSDDDTPSINKDIKDIKDVVNPPTKKTSAHQEMFGLLCVITRKDPKTMRSRIGKLGKQLKDAGYTLEDLQNAYGPDGTWWTDDWRGKKGQEPTMAQVLSEIGKYSGKVQGIQRPKTKTMAERAAEIDGGMR